MHDSKKRKSEAGEDEILTQLVESNDVSKKIMKLSKYQHLEVMARNLLKDYVQGQQCSVLLVSGSKRSTWMFFSLAERLGLVTSDEEVTVVTDLWLRIQKAEGIKLRKFVMTLEGGLQVRTTMYVFLKYLKKDYDHDDVVLHMNQLYRGGVVHTVSDCGSSIYVRHPECLRHRLRRNLQKVCVRRERQQVPHGGDVGHLSESACRN